MQFKTASLPELGVVSQFEYCGSAAPLCGKARPFSALPLFGKAAPRPQGAALRRTEIFGKAQPFLDDSPIAAPLLRDKHKLSIRPRQAADSRSTSQPGKTKTDGWHFRARARVLTRSTPSRMRSFSIADSVA